MKTPREIELKLEFRSRDAERLRAAVAAASKVSQTRSLRSVYFDTADNDLRAAGFSLRIRHDGERRLQTLKSDANGAGLFNRAESECEIAGDIPVIAPDDPVAGFGKIEEKFRTEVDRTTAILADEATEVECAIDVGNVCRGGLTKPLNEIEFELRRGSIARLFALARELDVVVPLRLGILTKSERGYRLCDADTDAAASKAEPIVLDRAMTVEAAFEVIMASCMRHYRMNEAVLLETSDPGALHQTRVALRRLRSALTLFKDVATDDRFAALRDDVRALAAVLGKARDLDVLLETSLTAEQRCRVVEARDGAYAAVLARLEDVEGRRIILDICEWLTVGAWRTAASTSAAREQAIEAFASEKLRKLRRSLKRKGADLAEISDEDRHETRIAAKKLRYATEFLGSLFTAKKSTRLYKRFRDALEDVQSHLGTLNDMATAPLVLAGLGIAVSADPPPGPRRKTIRKAARAFESLIDAKRFW
ncbi:inorganic triphosphatase YgiF [Polymorphobacter multimanifer]|uniref:Inorganic triphosphatase YgiF n=1 Tax=Polymorphobacter multimanifer TaxID=1070431 RepID=A0A841L0R4_9SPHN|nr:CHAD domain-containing protein [Polymorphobacter multimanifer]MBB6226409.1 inorganic triphosphatase YgiF [Polymorphobacter multimanifer]